MVITNLSDPLFTRLLMSEPQKVVDRLVEHVWPRALHLVSTPVVVNGQEFGLLSKTVPIHMNQLEMWTKDSNGHGYGVFYQMAWNQVSLSYELQVSRFVFPSSYSLQVFIF